MDRRGVIGFPMRLMLAAVLLALCTPVLAEMTEGFRDQTYENEAQCQTDKIREASASLYMSGPGASRVVSLDIPAGYSITLGGEGAQAYSVTILKGDEEVMTFYSEHPSYRFIETVGEISGHCELLLSCERHDGGCGIRAAVI